MKKFKIAVPERFSFTATQRVKVDPRLEFVTTDDFEIILIRSKTKIDKKFLELHPNLKLVVTATSGFDHIDIHEAKIRDVKVYFCPEGNVHSAAELTILLALALVRKLRKAEASVKSGNWERDRILGTELYGKTWGILGLGRIGQKVAAIAAAMGMEVVAADPFVSDEVFSRLNVERMGLKELYTASDILSLHVPLTAKTKGIVNIHTMEHMSSHLLLINTSRGEVVQEADLIDGLRKNKIAGFALDVFNEEPLNPKSALLDFYGPELDNVVLTPHVGANTFEAFERSCHLAVDKAVDFIKGNTLTGDPFEEIWLE